MLPLSRTGGSAAPWKRFTLLLFAVTVLQLVYILIIDNPSAPIIPGLGSTSQRPRPQYDDDITGHNLMTLDQCGTEYPDLYREVDRSESYWKHRGHEISAPDVDISWRNSGAFRILIHQNKLRILETRNTFTDDGYRPRTLAVLSQIQQALWTASAVGEQIPTMEAAIIVDDISFIPPDTTHSVWTLTSQINDSAHDRHWLIPDFNFHSATLPGSSYTDLRQRAALQDRALADKIPKAVWRGVTWSNEALRQTLLAATAGKTWADTAVVDVGDRAAFLPPDALCRYALLLHTEGRSYSGRLGFLLNCDSLVVAHALEWKTHFTHLLVGQGPRQNYVPVRRDFADLESQVRWYLDHPREAQAVADEAVRVFRERYLTPTAVTCYWRRLMAAYGNVAFTPAVYELGQTELGTAKLRGLAFEEFVHLTTDYTPGSLS